MTCKNGDLIAPYSPPSTHAMYLLQGYEQGAGSGHFQTMICSHAPQSTLFCNVKAPVLMTISLFCMAG